LPKVSLHLGLLSNRRLNLNNHFSSAIVFLSTDEIVRESGNCNVVVYELNLASLKSVRKFADEILKNELRLDVLINNAGCAGIERKLTEDGLEYQMQSNYFGHFLLTNLLLGNFLVIVMISLFHNVVFLSIYYNFSKGSKHSPN